MHDTGNTFKRFYVIKDRQAIVFLDTFFAPLSLLHSCPRNLPVYKVMQTLAEMGIYRDNLSPIVIGDNLSPIIVISQNKFDLSITDIAFVTYFVIADKLSQLTIFQARSVLISKLVSWRYGENTRCPLGLVVISKIISLFCFISRQSL